MKRALLIKMSSLGDVVHALPAVTDAARHGWRFDWVVEEAFADIPAQHPAVDQVLPIAWRRWRKSLWRSRSEMRAFRHALRGTSYDVVLDSQGLVKSAAVVRMSRGAVRAGYAASSAREPLAARAYSRNHEVAREQHAIDRQRQLFAAALGYALEGEPDYGLQAELRGPDKLCVFLHGTTWASKHYPDGLWLELAERVRADGFQIAVTWGNETERARAERIAEEGGATIWPRQPLAELMPRLAGASVVVGVDSGLTHLAAAFDRPTVAIYGSTNAALTGCRGRFTEALAADFPCSPCMSRECTYTGSVSENRYGLIKPPCYATLGAEIVWHHAMERMRAHRLLHL